MPQILNYNYKTLAALCNAAVRQEEENNYITLQRSAMLQAIF